MLQRTKQTLALSLMVPLVASVGISAASTSSSAAVNHQQSYNGSFDAGRTGWYFGTSRTRVSIVNRGVGGGKAMKLVNRRTGQVVFAGRHIRSAGEDLTYDVSMWVRGNQPGLTRTDGPQGDAWHERQVHRQEVHRRGPPGARSA